jgi:hypothetical protein
MEVAGWGISGNKEVREPAMEKLNLATLRYLRNPNPDEEFIYHKVQVSPCDLSYLYLLELPPPFPFIFLCILSLNLVRRASKEDYGKWKETGAAP